MDNQNHCMGIKQARLIVNAHKHNLLNSFCYNGIDVFIKQHENTTKINQKSRERERERCGYMKGMQGVSDWSLKKGGLWSGWSVVSVVSVVSQQLSNCATIGYCCCCYSHYKYYDC